jgi:hypothetical protein
MSILWARLLTLFMIPICYSHSILSSISPLEFLIIIGNDLNLHLIADDRENWDH